MTLGKRNLSLRGEVTTFPWTMTAAVSLCQHAVSVSPGGSDTSVMNSVEEKPFLTLPTNTTSSTTKASWQFKLLPSEGKTDVFSEIRVICRNHCHEGPGFEGDEDLA